LLHLHEIQPMMTREEILAVYEAGPEAVVTLVQSLFTQFEAQIQTLNERVRELEIRLAKDSHNSHKPPSSDEPTFRRGARKSLRKRSGKKPGGQPGHRGCTRLQVEAPDAVHLHMPDSCARCGDDLQSVESVPAQRRQVFDLPPLRLHVQEHQVHDRRCTGCGHTTRAAFPQGVDEPVQYGPGVLGLGLYLQHYQLLPYGRAAGLIGDLFGQTPSQGTLARALEQAHERLAPVEEQIHAGLRLSPIVHFDETGLRIASARQWVHSAGTATLTLYRAHPKRGREAIDAMGVLPDYEGVSIHDAYTSYLSYSGRHALCNAHLLRELVAVEEETQATWAAPMRELLLEIKAAAAQARAVNAAKLEPAWYSGLATTRSCARAKPPTRPVRPQGERADESRARLTTSCCACTNAPIRCWPSCTTSRSLSTTTWPSETCACSRPSRRSPAAFEVGAEQKSSAAFAATSRPHASSASRSWTRSAAYSPEYPRCLAAVAE
jgi:transposase